MSTKESTGTVSRNTTRAAERFGDRPAARWKEGDEWREKTFSEVAELVDELALGLIALGIEAGDRVAVLANTRPEWSFASYAATSAGCTVVPVYPTNSPEECAWVVGNSGAKAIFCEDAEQVAKIEKVRSQLTDLEHVIVFEGDGGLPLDELRERGKDADTGELERRRDGVAPDDPYTIIYTSGTTGPPKGVVLTHSNAAAVGHVVNELGIVTSDDSTYLYLPLAHSFALTVHLAAYEVGGPIVYFGGDTRQIIPELAEAKPTYFPSVPRIFEKLYTMGTSALAKASPEDRERFDKAVEVGLKVRLMQHEGEEVPAELQQAFDQADESVFKPVRQLFGGNLRQAITGAAPIAAEILKFFYAAGVPVLEGWGMTETTGIGTVNTLDNFKFGTVGQPTPGTEVKIADDGEVLLRGITIFKEYWANPDATAETFEGEWLKTGDLGSIDDEGYLSITGRKKDIIITAGGKNLTPANLENDLKQSRWISQAVMYGDRRPYPVALITLDPEEIVPWAKGEGEPEDLAALAKSEKVRELIQGELDAVNAKYAQVEQIKKFTILDHDLSQETGELTPTLKVKRNVVNERYEELFNELYGGRA
jgi:long-chain acyl-CoA synthetase